MTDDELLELLESKTPEEFTEEEIALLRARLASSPQVREALAARLRLESNLAAVLGKVNIPIDLLLADGGPRRRESVLLPLLGILACLVALALLIAALFVSLGRSNVGQPEQVAAGAGDGEKGPHEESGGTQPGTDENDDSSTSPGDAAHVGADADVPMPPHPVAEVKLPLVVEAASFARGNVIVDKEDWGAADDPVIHSGNIRPSFAEYELFLPRAGRFRLKLRYAAFDSRPLELFINGKKADRPVAGEQTGGNLLDAQKWMPSGEYEFVEGLNVLRLASSFKFPYVSRLEIDDPLMVAAVDPANRDPADRDPADRDPAVGDPANPRDPDGGDPENPADPGPQPPRNSLPWDAAVAATEVPPFEQVCFDDFDTSASLPRRDDLHKWVAPVEGERYVVNEVDTHLGRCAAFEGIVRLKSPWLADSALRLSLENFNRLQIHFFHGRQGATLVYYESERFRWAGYATTRQAGAARPDGFALTATDDGRCRRTEIRFGGPIELRYREGEVILSRGDVVLLRVPLPGEPEEVYLEGRAAFHGIALVRESGFPEREPELPVVLDNERPAELAWHEQLAEKARVEKTKDGHVRLIADRSPGRSWIAAPLPRRGLQMIELEVEDAAQGAGVFLGREGGRPMEVLRLTRNRRDGSSCWMTRGEDDAREQDFGAIRERLVPRAAQPRQWIRLLFGAGQLRWWISSDGLHWAEPELPLTHRPAGITHVGLQCVAGAPDCRITLRRLRVRELSHLAALATPEALAQALGLKEFASRSAIEPLAAGIDADKPEPFFEKLAPQRPQDIDPPAWRRACAVAALAAGSPERLGQAMVAALLDGPQFHALPPAEQLAVLDDAALVYDSRSRREDALAMVRRYHRVGLDAEGEIGAHPFSFVRKALMTSPICDEHNFAVGDVEPIRTELIQLAYRQQWPAVLEFCRRLRFFQQQQEVPLVAWAEATAARSQPGRPGSADFARLKDEWRQPVVEEFSKQAYNTMAELEALLESDALDAAARMITSLDPETLGGVAPAAHDRRLLVSLPAAVRLAVRRYPELARAINERHGPLARLRIHQAIEAGDVSAVELAAVQFETTDAAAEAHQWLGDRALATGWFARALAEYRRAEKTAGILLRRGLQARIRLASAMLGQDVGEPATGSVQFGDVRMTAAEFEKMVAQMRDRHESGDSAASLDGESSQPVPPPGEYELSRRDKLDGPWGERPNAEITRHVRRYGVPWVDRQLAETRVGNMLYVSNRFQVSAFELPEGRRVWRSEQPRGGMQRSQDWTLTPMRPLVTADRVYARLLYGSTPLLTALERETGKLVWTASLPSQQSLVSDPLVVQEKLAAFAVARTDQQQSVLSLVTFDPASGETIAQHDVLRIRDSWWTRRFFAAAALDDSLVASLGGATLCCDLSGNLRWVRAETVLPAEEESSWVTQRFQPPLLHDARLYVAQPGVRAVECLEVESGDLVWSRVLPDMRGILGFAGGRVIVETDGGAMGLDAGSGATAWKSDVPERLDASLCGEKTVVLAYREAASENNNGNKRVGLVWLDGAAGRRLGGTVVEKLEHRQPYLGGLLAFEGRLLAFYGTGDDDPQRELVELTPRNP